MGRLFLTAVVAAALVAVVRLVLVPWAREQELECGEVEEVGMPRFAVVNPATSIVVNVIDADVGFSIPGKALVESDTANPGDFFDGTNFITPPVPPPTRLEELVERLLDPTPPGITLVEIIELLQLEHTP